MKFKHVLLAIMFATVLFTSCKKDEEKPSKEDLIASLNLSQTTWKGSYTDRFFILNSDRENVPKVYEHDIALSFFSETEGRYQIDDLKFIRDFDYKHDKNIVRISNVLTNFSGVWWIIDITEDTLYLQKNMDLDDNRLLCELKLTRVY